MPRTTVRESSHLPALVMGCAGLALGGTLVHDLVDRRLLTAESIFNSPMLTVLAILGVTMAGILAWDAVSSRHPR